MQIPVTCSQCGQAFRVDAKFAGRRGRCPNPDCQSVYTVPQLADDVAEEIETEGTSRPRRRESLSWGQRAASRKRPDATRRPRHWDRPSFLVGALVSALVTSAVIGVMALRSAPQQRSQAAEAPAAASTASTFTTDVLPVVTRYCGQCHGGTEPEAGISFAKYQSEADLLQDRKTWERCFDLIEGGTMPPPDSPQPTAEEKARLLDALERSLFRIDCTQVSDPGRVTIRRLNRTEYNNTIRDLLGVTVRPADDFPSDDVGYGFDNIGDVLSLPPLLMEKYLDAADKIAAEAIPGAEPTRPTVREFPRDALSRSRAMHPHGDDAVILVTEGDVGIEFEFPRAGEYSLRVAAAETPAGNEPAKMAFRLEGATLQTFEVRARDANPKVFEHRFRAPAGRHRLAVAFLNDFYDEKARDRSRRDRNLILRDIQVSGPLDGSAAPAAPSALLAVLPGPDTPVAVAARRNLAPLMRRAFRRPITDAEVDRYTRIVDAAVAKGESFPFGMRVALSAILVSPYFLFRIETDRNPNDPSDTHPLNEYELASRLSYFLWSSMPDELLLAQAAEGNLHQDAVLDDHVRRMLKDPRSKALVENFAEQWLQLRILNEITPDPALFPEFTAELREDMKQETRRFFEHILREDRSILEFLDAPYTFVNGRLARHYGMTDVDGEEFRRVDLSGRNRAGLLTHASILSLTSNPDRTSPVKRGKWVMEVLLDKPPPPPPPDVPELAESAKAAPDASLRQQLELHRQNPTCNSCHQVMDQLGFGMENFDAIGRWRDQDHGKPLDTSGVLPGGAGFRGPVELARVLRRKDCEFSECLAEKMLTYALGRGLEYYDRCATDKIVKALKQQQFRFSVLVTEIVKSQPFRMRRGETSNP